MPKSAGQNRGHNKIEALVVRLLTKENRTLVTAESCTGGLIANRITNVPGASNVFFGGMVAYSNPVKRKFLGVRAKTLQRYGAVSRPVAREMAEGARKKFKADFAIAVTGIAGPSGGTKAKPVGTVFIALAGRGETIIEQKLNRAGRAKFKELTSQQALELLYQHLLNP